MTFTPNRRGVLHLLDIIEGAFYIYLTLCYLLCFSHVIDKFVEVLQPSSFFRNIRDEIAGGHIV